MASGLERVDAVKAEQGVEVDGASGLEFGDFAVRDLDRGEVR